MVASASVDALPVAKSRQCTAPEHYFARLIACEGHSPTRAYRLAWKSTTAHASDLAPRVLARPHVAARIAELRAQADREAVLSMNERRRLLAETARKAQKAKPSAADGIAAIREDAILAGERRTDGTQVSVGVAVGLGDVLGGLGGALVTAAPSPVGPPAAQGTPQTVDLPAGAVVVSPEAESRPVVQPVTPAQPVSPLDGLGGAMFGVAPADSWTDE